MTTSRTSLLSMALALTLATAAGCGGGAVDCPVGQTACDGACVDVLTDGEHCGTCGNTCGAGLLCGNGTCAAECPADQLECSEGCSDPMTDENNCGGCGAPCAANEECRGGTCEIPCAQMLTAPVTDQYGLSWDGLERTAATLDAAAVSCEAFGGRLPSATELFRVNATRTDEVAQAFHTNPLWSRTASTRTEQVAITLATGAVSDATASAPLAYRCVCAPPTPPFFGGARCNGPAGAACFSVGRYLLDAEDRVPLRKSAALQECAAERAGIADVPLLVAAIIGGLPGSGQLVQTADQATYFETTQVRWSGDPAAWTAVGNLGATATTNRAPFRCAGPGFAAGTNPNPISGEFVGQDGGFKGEVADSPTAGWTAAHDACTSRGGHLARSAEMASLLIAGLPGGSNTFLWTADQNGYNGTDFLSSLILWNGLDPRTPYEYAGGGGPNYTTTWYYKNSAYPFRCIYYPLDPAFQAPTTCTGGCFSMALPGPVPATMWFDSNDRGPATWTAASAACRAEGGRLASARDLTEAIRGGLPNGPGPSVWLHTSELGGSPAIAGGPNTLITHWTGVEPTFSDLWSTHMTWAGVGESHYFRCMWSNELR
jgi:hypothetical protein